MAKKSTQDVQEPGQDTAGVASSGNEQALLEAAVGESGDVVSADLEAPAGVQDSDASDQESPVVMVECAVLLDCIYGKHDDIISLTQSEAKSAQAGGYVDTHPNAIKAIRGL